MYTRRNIWDLGNDWADPVLWYARGVAALRARPLTDPMSWRFYGAIHGFDGPLWQALGYLSSTEPRPSRALVEQFWAQCQHGSWYFLPWHRGYLLAFEANVRDAVIQLGGPSDWALPYWNYFKAGESALPRAFASADWPDGTGDNPLFVRERYGPGNDGNVYVPVGEINLNAMNDPDFTGVSGGGSPGFGGVDTGFSHGGPVHGGIETQPHDWVHGLVGGGDPATNLPGLMSDPDTAGLDPIFWLHHANIDRLWQSWVGVAPHADPTEPDWLKGPVGPRDFVMPMPGGTPWTYTPEDMVDIETLGYAYDDLTPAVAAGTPERVAPPASLGGPQPSRGDVAVELVGASSGPVPVRGDSVDSSVRLDSPMRGKVTEGLLGGRAAPDRLFLNLENVRGRSDADAFHVYVGVPDGEDPADHPDRLAGSIAPFGMRKASAPDCEHGGQGLTFVLEITGIVDAQAFGADTLPVRIVPVRPVADSAELSIGRISVFRQGE